MTASTKAGTTVARFATPEAALSAYPEMIMSIPLAEPDDGSGILAGILMAETWEDLQGDSAKLPDAVAMVGKELRIHSIARYESDIAGSLGWYLVVQGTNTNTGEVVKFQTSASSVMGKLVKLSQFRKYPFVGKITKADKATRGGFYPLDLDIIAVEPKGTPGY